MKRLLNILFFIWTGIGLTAQCDYEITLTLVSVNFVAGCDFNDTNGIDASIVIVSSTGQILIENEVENLSQVTEPAQNVPFDLSSNSDCCDNGYTSSLGTYPAWQTAVETTIQIYDNDGGCCDGYQPNSDDNFGISEFIFDINEPMGTIQVGSCISFNYVLDFELIPYTEGSFQTTICPLESIEVGNMIFDQSNDFGQAILAGQAANGCDSVVLVELDFFDLNAIDIAGPTNLCPGGEVQLEVEPGISNLLWSTGESTLAIAVDTIGSFSVTGFDENNCLVFGEANLIYFSNSMVVINGPSRFCEGEEIELFVEDVYATYLWDDGSTNPKRTIDESGSYSLTVTNAAGCVIMSSFDTASETLEAEEIVGESEICYGTLNTLSGPAGLTDYLWSTGEETRTIETGIGGTYQLTVTNDIGCTDLLAFELIELPLFLVRDTLYTCEAFELGTNSFDTLDVDGCLGVHEVETQFYKIPPAYILSSDQTIVARDTAQLSIDIDLNDVLQISWFLNDSLLCVGCSLLEVSPPVSAIYRVEIQYHEECTLVDEVLVRVVSSKEIYIPNVFSLALTGTNGQFKIEGLDIEFIHEMLIYDRWGNIVHRTSGLDSFWDGTLNGNRLESGVYVYLLDLQFFDGIRETRVGDVTLIQ